MLKLIIFIKSIIYEKYKLFLDDKEKKFNFIKKSIFFIKDLLIIFLIVFLIKLLIFEPFQISGQSMAESYYDKEFVIVDKFSYLDIPYIKTGEINRGDVVVFKPGLSKDKKYFLKRVIGIPGDSIKIYGGNIYLKKRYENDFKKLDEKFLSKKNYNNTTVGKNKSTISFEYFVPEGDYFVLGDNRANSNDSRVCFDVSCKDSKISSYIKKHQIVGKIFIDLGYFDLFSLSFRHPGSDIKGYDPDPKGILTIPKWFSSASTYNY